MCDLINTRRLSRPGVVYFVAISPTANETYVKIGWTGEVLSKRLTALQCGCPFPLDVLATVKGTEGDERKLHSFFAERREQGEWFVFENLDELWPVIDRAGSRVRYGNNQLTAEQITERERRIGLGAADNGAW